MRYVVRYVISYHEVSYHDVSDNGILFQNFLENCRENIAKTSRKSLENHYEIIMKSPKNQRKSFLKNYFEIILTFLKKTLKIKTACRKDADRRFLPFLNNDTNLLTRSKSVNVGKIIFCNVGKLVRIIYQSRFARIMSDNKRI